MQRARRVPQSFFKQPTPEVARALIGMRLVRAEGSRRRIGRIVETEAYLGPQDLAAHSARGRRTARTEVMFGPPGHAYVYFIYGVWNCLNVVTGESGVPHAVLLRALEPLSGIRAGTSGPGLLCRALHIDRRLNGVDLRGETLWLEAAPPQEPAPRILRSARIGVEYAGSWARRRWRFYDAQSDYVSGARAQRQGAARGGVGK